MVELPQPNYELDGESLVPFLKNSAERNKPMVFAVQEQGAVIEQQYKLVCNKGVNELYDISKDPSETTDLSLEYPEITKRLRIYLERSLERYQQSFEGQEHGTRSYQKVKQAWHDIFQTTDTYKR